MRLLPLLLVLALAAGCAGDDAPPAETPPVTEDPLDPPPAPPETPPLDEDALLGAWACEEGVDPEIAFRVVDGERVFTSFLHERPSRQGTWHVREGTLTVQTDDGLTYLFPFASVEEDRLELEGPAVRWTCTRVTA